MNRLPALDNAKGIAIAAVIVFHVLRGFHSAGMIDGGIAARFADAFAYGFHVQTFFVIAGYFAWPRADKLAFQRDRQFSLYYSYLFWSIVSWMVAYALSGRVNTAVTTEELLYLPVRPIEHFWFLLILMIGTAALAALRTPRAILMGIGVLAAMTLLDVVHWYAVCECVIFVLTGAWLRAGPGLPPVRSWAAWLGVVLLAIGAWISVTVKTPLIPIWLIWSSFGGVYACYALASHIAGYPMLSRIFSFLGRHSMPLYLLHIFGGSGTRIILKMVVPQMAMPGAVMLSILGSFLVPLVIYGLARRMGITKWIGLDPIVVQPPRPMTTSQPA
ncbi:acyltransferase family protein [Sphingobium sp. CR28]|uniref:acyltransferase family protein n=1 Tax=Sphingobium sp. CR28 TaxID=3400272 RepID=UPI003FEE4A42